MVRSILVPLLRFLFPSPACTTGTIGVAAIMAVYRSPDMLTVVGAGLIVALAPAFLDHFWPSDSES